MKYLIYIYIIISPLALCCQDVHFSQFYISKSFLNPALLGKQPEKIQLKLHTRSQWSSVSVPFKTNYISVDIKDVIFENNFGLNILQDVSGDSYFKTFGVGFTLSRQLLSSDKHKLSVGSTFSFLQKSFDPTSLVFLDQEYFTNTELRYFDLFLGLDYDIQLSDNSNISVGFSLDHVNKADFSFVNQTKSGLEPKQIYYLLFSYQESNNLEIIPSLSFSKMSKVSELIFGLQSNYKASWLENKTCIVSSGFFIRNNDAAIFLFGLEINQAAINFSYDVNTSSLAAASNNFGAYELSLVYNIKNKSRNTNNTSKRCPSYL